MNNSRKFLDSISPGNYRLLILQLIGISLLITLSIDIYLPSLPDIGRSLHATKEQTDFSMGLFIFGFAIGQLVYGPLSDSYGRKPILFCGLIIYLFSSLLCCCAPNISVLLVARFLQAIGACAGPITAFAIVKDVYQKQDSVRVISYITTTMTISPVIAPLIGSYLQTSFGWRSNFIFLALFSAILMIVLFKKLPETNKKINRSANVRFIFSLLDWSLDKLQA